MSHNLCVAGCVAQVVCRRVVCCGLCDAGLCVVRRGHKNQADLPDSRTVRSLVRRGFFEVSQESTDFSVTEIIILEWDSF